MLERWRPPADVRNIFFTFRRFSKVLDFSKFQLIFDNFNIFLVAFLAVFCQRNAFGRSCVITVHDPKLWHLKKLCQFGNIYPNYFWTLIKQKRKKVWQFGAMDCWETSFWHQIFCKICAEIGNKIVLSLPYC